MVTSVTLTTLVTNANSDLVILIALVSTVAWNQRTGFDPKTFPILLNTSNVLPLNRTPGQLHQFHTLTSCYFNIHFNIIFPHTA